MTAVLKISLAAVSRSSFQTAVVLAGAAVSQTYPIKTRVNVC